MATCTRKNAPPAAAVIARTSCRVASKGAIGLHTATPAVAGDLGGHPADPADVGLAVLAAEGQAGRQVPAYDVAVQAGDRALAALEQGVDDRLGDRRLPAPGQAGEEQHQPLLPGAGPVGLDDRGDVVGVVAVAVAERQHRVGPGVRRDHVHPEVVVDGRVAVRGQRYGDHGGLRAAGARPPARPAAARPGRARACPGPVSASSTTGLSSAAQALDLALGEGVHDRDERGARRAASRTCAGDRCSRRNGPCWAWVSASTAPSGASRASGSPSGSTSSTSWPASSAGQVEGDRRPGLVEPGDRGQRPAGQQLEVGELPRGRAVLGRRHGTILPASLPWPDACHEEPCRPGRGDRAQRVRRGTSLRIRGRARPPTARWRGRSATSTSPVLPRSCNKPLQALGMLRAGLDLPPDLLALACASHSGEPFHVEGVRRLLASAGLTEADLQTPPDYPLDDAAREQVIRDGRREGAGADELLRQARRDARHLCRQRLADRAPTSTPTTRCSGRIAADRSPR